MAKNWKKEYGDLEKRYANFREKHWNCWNTSEKWAYSLLCVIFTVGALFFILFIAGVLDSPINRLNLEDELASIHTLKYYPEFENCSIQYDECVGVGFCTEGVEIYCSKLDDRDGLRTKIDKTPTEVLYFDGITLKDILFEVLNDKS